MRADAGRTRAATGGSRLTAVRRRVRRRVGRMLRRIGVLPQPPAPPAPPIVRAGLVERFDSKRLSGWVAVAADAPPVRVSLYLNKLEIASTWATDPMDRTSWGQVRPFRFRIDEVWQYARKWDRLVVRVEGNALPIYQVGMYLRPARNGSLTPADLEARMAEGYLFGQKGVLQLSKKLDVAWQKEVLNCFEQVRSFIRSSYGYETFLMYGSLLGAVRERGFIGHDLDFDAGYISSHTDGPSAAAELRDIGYAFLDAGYAIRSKGSHLHVIDSSGTRIDLFHMYFDADDRLAIPYGIAGTTTVCRDDWQDVREIEFPSGTAVIPVNAEQFVEHLYGSAWREPKPGFSWWLDRTTRAAEGMMPQAMIDEIHWANFYTHEEIAGPSQFCARVDERGDTPAFVIDIGCGDGRDALALAGSGRHVLGIDRSHTGIRRAIERSGEAGLSDRLRFVCCDIDDPAAFRETLGDIVGTAGEAPVLFYLRFLLHAISAQSQDALLREIDSCARPGDMLAAEFRTDKDEARPKAFGAHFRRFQNGPEFGARLREEFSFTVLEEHEATGLSPCRGEDPELYRVVAQRTIIGT